MNRFKDKTSMTNTTFWGKKKKKNLRTIVSNLSLRRITLQYNEKVSIRSLHPIYSLMKNTNEFSSKVIKREWCLLSPFLFYDLIWHLKSYSNKRRERYKKNWEVWNKSRFPCIHMIWINTLKLEISCWAVKLFNRIEGQYETGLLYIH